jgi:hypothetical protein
MFRDTKRSSLYHDLESTYERIQKPMATVRRSVGSKVDDLSYVFLVLSGEAACTAAANIRGRGPSPSGRTAEAGANREKSSSCCYAREH